MDEQDIVIVDASGNEHHFPSGFDPKKAAGIVRAKTSESAPSGPRQPASAEQFMTPEDIANRDMTGMDVLKGVGKGALRSVADLVNTAATSRMIPGLTPQSLPPEVVEKATPQYKNPAQELGGTLETTAELALPILKGASAIPRVGRAAGKLQGVMSAAKDVPLDVAATGDAALRIQQLAERGGAMPMVVRKFLGRVTDPQKAPMAYEEGRDFASNISRLSADEFQRLTPVVRREVGAMRAALNKSLTDAAETVGKGKDYASGMSEYAKAMKLRGIGSDVLEGAKRALPIAGGGGAGYLLMRKLMGE